MSSSPGSFVRWLIVIIAAIGFAFDIYELLMLPLILRPAILELSGLSPTDPNFAQFVSTWRSIMFYVPALAGGIFGLYGGYLTDLLGRRRVLTWSILLYSVSAFLAGFSTSLPMLLVLRCTTFIGVCVEFVAAIAWLAELFPEPNERERVLGYTQAFSSFGGLMIAFANSIAIAYAADLPPISIPGWAAFLGSIDPAHAHEAWRYTLMSGLIPAIPLLVIRPFLPESPAWQHKKAAGTLKRPSIWELFAPAYARTTIVTTVLFACAYGVAFGAIQQIPEIVPGLADVQAKTAKLPLPQQKAIEQKVASDYVKVQELGGLAGRFLLAMLAVRIMSRQRLLRLFQVPAMVVVPLVFFTFLSVENQTFFVFDMTAVPFFGRTLNVGSIPITTVSVGIFFAAMFIVAQFSFWGNYLPLVYPVRLRGTGESFAANIGGRMIGTGFAAVTSMLASRDFIPGNSLPAKFAFSAAAVALALTALGLGFSYMLPEPGNEEHE